MEELAHFIAIVCNQVEETQRLIGSLHVDIDLPSKVWLLIHDVASAEPAQVDVVTLILLTLNLKKRFFSIFVVSRRSRSDSEVPVEIVIV